MLLHVFRKKLEKKDRTVGLGQRTPCSAAQLEEMGMSNNTQARKKKI
jgi:hypothetical protein